MLPCPYCRTPLAEDTPACPSCEFDLARAKAVMGPIPRLEPSGLSDFTGTITRRDLRRLEKSRRIFMHRFPQTRVQIVFSRFRTDFPLPVTLFWLFNLGGFSTDEQKNGQNRDLLIAVDPQQACVGITTGYGLEPFLSAKAIDRLLAHSAPHFQTGDLTAGVERLLELLSDQLSTLSRDLPAALGITRPLAIGKIAGEY